MPPGELLANRKIPEKTKPNQQNYQGKDIIMETFKVLGRTLTAFIPYGTTMEKAFVKAVESAGGKVFRKYYAELKKYEIVAVVFRDAALVKNDPGWVAEQDFSYFGKDEKKIKEMTIKKAKEAEGGLHFFEGEKGIPVLVDKEGRLTFLSPDEMLARENRKKKPIEVREVLTNIDPKTIEESREGARAIREKDQAVLERLEKAGADHANSREKSIKPLSTYALIDADTGDKMKASELNSGLGNDILVSKERFVPEILLIKHFARDSQVVPVNDGCDKPDWEQNFRMPEAISGKEVQLPSVYNVCIFDVQPEDQAFVESNADETQQFDAKAVACTVLFENTAKNDVDTVVKTPKALSLVPPQAASFDGFAPAQYKSFIPSPIGPETKTENQTARRSKTKDFESITYKRKESLPFKSLGMRPILSSFDEALKKTKKDQSERAGKPCLLNIKRKAFRSTKTSKISREKAGSKTTLIKQKKRKAKKYSKKNLKKNAGKKKRAQKKKSVRKKLMPVGNRSGKTRSSIQSKKKTKNKNQGSRPDSLKRKNRNVKPKPRKPKVKTQDRKPNSSHEVRKKRRDPKPNARQKQSCRTQKSRSKTRNRKHNSKPKTRTDRTKFCGPWNDVSDRTSQRSVDRKSSPIYRSFHRKQKTPHWKPEMLGLTSRKARARSSSRKRVA